MLAALVFLLATFAHAQNSQFLFDPNGNLLVQTGATNAPPQITRQPQNQVVGPGETAAFSVVATGTLPLTFQWRINIANIGGATGDTLLLENVSANDEDEYRVVVTNPSGSVTSAPAFLFLDSDHDGLGDPLESFFFGNLNQNATSDRDGDGSSNLEEFRNRTDPTDANSYAFRLLVINDAGTVIKTPDRTTYSNGQTVTLTAIPPPNGAFHAWLGDIVTRSNPVTLVMTKDKTVYARFTPIEFNWTNVASGDWNVAAHWKPNLVPGSNDTVMITNNLTVTLDTPADCADVTLGSGAGSNPTLTGTGQLTVRGHFVWASGAMSGNGRTVLEPGARLTLDNPSQVVLNARTLELGGETFWTGPGNVALNSAVITNRAGAVFEIENSAAFNMFLGASRIDNAGTFRKSFSGGTTTIGSGVSFNNSGTVEIQTGTLNLGGGGTHSGSFDVPAGTALILSGGFHAAGGSSSITGAGQFTISGGAATLAGLVNVSGSNIFSGTANLTGNYICTNNTLTISGLSSSDTANFSGTGLVSPAVLNLSNGILTGTSTVTVHNVMNWTGGAMSGSGRTIIPVGATLNAAIPSGVTMTSRTLENGGTALWTGAGNIGLFGGAVITNRAGALFHAQNATSLGFFAANRFDNAGTFRKSANNGTLTIGSFGTFNNFGTVEIEAGTVLISGGFNNSGAVSLLAGTTNRLAGGGSASGAFGTPATALVEWTAGTFTLSAGAQLNGAGLYRINGGSVTANANVNVANLDFVHGSSTLDGTGAVTISNAMNWTAGVMSGSGRTTISAGATLQVGSASGVNLQRTLENGGTAIWTGAGTIILLNGVITNRAGALFHAQNAATLFPIGGVRFDNAGTFRKSANTGTTTVQSGMSFNNSGMVDIRSGILVANGSYVSSSSALLNCALGGTTAGTGYGQLQVAGAVTLNGTLSVDLTTGFSPALNDSFTVLTAGTRNGTFGNFLYPSNVVTMQLSNTANSVIVRVSGLIVPQPMLFPPVLSSSNVLLSWTTESNKTYRLEFNPDLRPTNWNVVPGDVTTLSNRATKLDALTSSNRFYRVRILP